MGAFEITGIQDRVEGSMLRVGWDGAARTAPGLGATGESGVQGVLLGAEWTEVVPANEYRRAIQLQNQHASVGAFIRLSDDTEGTLGWRIDAGGTYSFPPGVSWVGVILGRADSETVEVNLAILEFSEPREEE